MYFKHILVTTDFSANAAAAYEMAAYQAKFEGSQVTLLNVVSDWVVPASFYEYIPQPARIDEYRRDLVDRAKAELTDIARKHLHAQSVKCVALPSGDPPYKLICDYARDHECSLIIMGSHGRGAIGSLLLGSNTQRVIQHAPCPVLVMPRHPTA